MRAIVRSLSITLGVAMTFSASSLPANVQQTAKWRLVEEFRVGGEPDGPHSFLGVRGLRVFPDGRIIVFDYKDQQVHFLAADGQPVRTVGRKGAGPGEFREANGIVILPNGQVVVNDPSNVRLTILSSTGDLVRTVPYQNWGYSYFWDGRVEPDGRLSEYLSYRKAGDTINAQGRRIWARDFSKNDTISVSPPCPAAVVAAPDDYRYSFRTARGGGVMSIPYVYPRASSVTASDGNVWYGVYPQFTTVERRAPGKCDVLATVRLGGGRIPVSRAQRDTAEGNVKKFYGNYGADLPDLGKIPRELPGYDALFLDASNRLWVERPAAAGPHHLEVFSPTGAPIAELAMPFKISGVTPVITNDRLYSFTTDSDGLQYLVVLKIVRN